MIGRSVYFVAPAAATAATVSYCYKSGGVPLTVSEPVPPRLSGVSLAGFEGGHPSFRIVIRRESFLCLSTVSFRSFVTSPESVSPLCFESLYQFLYAVALRFVASGGAYHSPGTI